MDCLIYNNSESQSRVCIFQDADACPQHSSFFGSYNLAKSGDQCLRKPKAEDKLGSRHQQFRRHPLEETCDTFILHHATHNPETTLWVVKIPILDSGFDDV